MYKIAIRLRQIKQMNIFFTSSILFYVDDAAKNAFKVLAFIAVLRKFKQYLKTQKLQFFLAKPSVSYLLIAVPAYLEDCRLRGIIQ